MRRDRIIGLALVATLVVGSVGALLYSQQQHLSDARSAADHESGRAETALGERREALKDLAGTEERLEASRASEQRLRSDVEEARAEADDLSRDVDQQEALLNDLWAMQDLQTDCHNAWSDFVDGYDDRSIAEDQPYIDHAVAVCDDAASAFN